MRPKKYKLKQINNFQSEQNNNFPQMKYLTKSCSMPKMEILNNYNYDSNIINQPIYDNNINEENDKLNDIRNNEYQKLNLKIDKIKDSLIKLKRILKEQITINQSYNRTNFESLEKIDLSILQEIHNEKNINIEIKKRNLIKKNRDMEIISDRILNNSNYTEMNNMDSQKDIYKLGKYLKEEIDMDIYNNNYIKEKNMDNIDSGIYILNALSYILNKEGITTIIVKNLKNKKILNAILQLISSGLIFLKIYNLKLNFGGSNINDNIIFDPLEKNKLRKKFLH